MGRTGRQKVVRSVLSLAAIAALSGCFQPTGAGGDAGGASGGDDSDSPMAPTVDDYSTLFVEQGLELPGAGADARIGRGSVSIADFDLDGDLDILLAGDRGGTDTAEIYLNDGAGSFTSANAGFTGVGEYAATAVADVNQDGTVDVFISGDEGGANGARLYTNQVTEGVAAFTETTTFGSPLLTQGPAQFFDADADGDPDLILGGLNGSATETILYLNQGGDQAGAAGDFAPSSAGSLSDASWRGSYAIADFDGQTGLDALVVGNGGSTSLANAGGGAFTATDSPVAESGWWTGVSHDDIDGDGTTDLLITGSSLSNAASLYTNDGNMVFTDVTSTRAPGLVAIREGASVFGDIDLDGDVDLFISGTESAVGIPATGQIRLYRNDGDGNFSEETLQDVFGTLRGTLHLFDVDGDTDLDLLVTGVRGASTPNAILHINTLFN